MRTFLLFILLFVFWCLLSGATIHPGSDHPVNTQLLIAALVSCSLSVWLVHRMNAIDEEGQPLNVLGLVTYAPWLAWQIVRANVDIARLVWSPRLKIQPRVIQVPVKLKTPLARATYANSITLTPGTVTIQLENDRYLVHALTDAAAEDLLSGEMERRVLRLEGTPDEEAKS
ncbi:MAG: Na+/H+ antiporter subunit E [Planctomycetota bacterium]